MPIEIAADNHIGELKRLSKSDLQYAAFETLEEFAISQETRAYSCDEDGFWACISNGVKYYGLSVESQKPDWATHVYWYGK
jgi:hypothetical protein